MLNRMQFKSLISLEVIFASLNLLYLNYVLCSLRRVDTIHHYRQKSLLEHPLLLTTHYLHIFVLSSNP